MLATHLRQPLCENGSPPQQNMIQDQPASLAARPLWKETCSGIDHETRRDRRHI